MTVVDFIDVIDDIIDLSSDEETVQQDHIATQRRVTLLDRQAVFVLAGEGRKDAQAAFISAVEANKAATESGNALLATASPSVTEKTPLHTAESQNCPSSPKAPFPSLTSTIPKVLSSEVGDTKQDVFVQAGEGRQHAQAAFDSAGEETQKANESGNTLVATASPSVMEKVPLDKAESKNCPSSPTSAPLPSPTSTTPKALTSEDGDTKPARVKHPKKNYHTSTPRRSPRFEQKHECFNSPVEELAADHKRSRMLDPAEESAAPTDNAESTKIISTDNAESTKNCPSYPASEPLPSPISTTPKALTSEVGDAKLVRVKHPKKNYHTSSPRRSPRFLECCNNPVEELAADHKRSRMLEPAEESAAPTDNAESTKTLFTDSAN